MAGDTHTRARAWALEELGAEDAGPDGSYHLRGKAGQRIRVAGRHIEGREPTYFHLGESLRDSLFDQMVVVLFREDWSVKYAYSLDLDVLRLYYKRPGKQDCRLMIRGNEGRIWRDDPRVRRLA